MPSLITPGTVVIGLLIAIAVVMVIIKLIRDRKKGKTACGSCSGCPMSGSCHRYRKDK